MNYRDKPALREHLAGEYVLGTLSGAARARFKGWMIADAALRRTVDEWQRRLAPMAAAIAPVTPPRRVWLAIAARIAAPSSSGPAHKGLWENLVFWRTTGLAASGVAAALLAAVVWVAPERPQPAPAPQIVRVPADVVPPSYVAVLADPMTRKPVLMVAAARKSDQLLVKRLDDSIMVADKSLELWALPAGQAPVSLGVVAPENKYLLKLTAVADQSLGEIPQLALSLEPKGGSPSGVPTGPVLYTGPCIKYW
ncbi:MAG: anti-sigma factor [Betaproteobacteria bacterium]|nr:anti-sigma factor [Betaproteobacteria bacterium]